LGLGWRRGAGLPAPHANRRGHPESGTTSGLVAYLDGEPVGWCAVEPRTAYPRLLRSTRVKAKEKAADDVPVVVFFDEMDALFRTRGTGISSDVETTIVPQLLAEIDGVEGLRTVIVIGASNRQDLIDPAILRPGRLDVKIKIERQGPDAARDILSKYLTRDLPIAEVETRRHGDAQAASDSMVAATVDKMYGLSEENRFLEVTYANGDKEVLYSRTSPRAP
jgi:proteasome-associated ATPase